jgi:hypothetical protein
MVCFAVIKKNHRNEDFLVARKEHGCNIQKRTMDRGGLNLGEFRNVIHMGDQR